MNGWIRGRTRKERRKNGRGGRGGRKTKGVRAGGRKTGLQQYFVKLLNKER